VKVNKIKTSIFTVIMLISTSSFSNGKWLEHSGGIINLDNFDYMTWLISSNGEYYCVDDKPVPANYKDMFWYGSLNIEEEQATDKEIKDDNLKPEKAYAGKVVFRKRNDMSLPGLFDSVVTPNQNFSINEDCDLLASEKVARGMLEDVVEKIRDFLGSDDMYLKLNIPGNIDFFDY
jgi:hypothetical protein